MYKIPYYENTTLNVNESFIGEPIETKIERLVTNGDDLGDGQEIVYTERKDGVMPEYDIRSDKWEIALSALDAAHKTDIAKRETSIQQRQDALDEMNGKKKEEKTLEKNDGKTEPTVEQ